MLYMVADLDDGKLVVLSLSAENVDEIKADNPLMAQLSYVGFPGYLFFLSIKGGKKQHEIKRLLNGRSVKHFIHEAKVEELDALAKGLGYFKVSPGSSLPGVVQILVTFSNDPKLLVQKLRKSGMATNEAVTFVPQDISAN